jgi:LruC domain-containing protein
MNNEYEQFSTKVTGNGFNGTDVCETDNLGHTNICRLESPWTSLIAGNIEFDHAVPSKNGDRKLTVYLINQSSNKTNIWSFTYTNSTPKHATIANTRTGIYKIRWEWVGNDGSSRGQLDNIIIPGTNVSDPSHDCEPIVVNPDTDGDGVPNNQDEYPTDPHRAYNNYYPASDTSTLAFEDLWPNYGDYDMNDLVIGYKFKIVSNAGHNVVEIFNTLIVRADGAGLLNGFGYQFPTVAPSKIISVTGVGEQTGYNIGANGVETENTSMATFIIFDDSHKFMSEWNTIKDGPVCPQKTFNVYIKFANNGTPASGGWISLSNLNISTWNPFMVKNSIRGQEIHLPNYTPTMLADYSLFGTGNDDTRPSAGKYYKSSTNLPWAIDIYGKFEYPVETVDISKAYLHFGQWAEGNGQLYLDWWSNKGSGYRDTNLIY